MSTENITLWGKLAQKTTVYDSPYIKRPERGTPTETGHRVVVARPWERQGLELTGKDQEVSFRDHEKVLTLIC